MIKIILIIFAIIIFYLCCSCFAFGLYYKSGMIHAKDTIKKEKQVLAIFFFGPFSIIWFFIFNLFKISFKLGENTARNINNKKK